MADASLDLLVELVAPTSIELRVNALLGLQMGLTGVGKGYLTRTATLGTTVGLTARGGFGGTATPSLALGLSGTVGTVFNGAALLATSVGLTGAGRANVTATFSTTLNLAGMPNVSGGMVTSAATFAMQFGLIGQQGIGSSGVLDIQWDLQGTGTAPRGSVAVFARATFLKDEARPFFRKT